jgi:hypothetical protein
VPPLAIWKNCIYPPSRHSLFSLFLSRIAPSLLHARRSRSSLEHAGAPALPLAASSHGRQPRRARVLLPGHPAPCPRRPGIPTAAGSRAPLRGERQADALSIFPCSFLGALKLPPWQRARSCPWPDPYPRRSAPPVWMAGLGGRGSHGSHGRAPCPPAGEQQLGQQWHGAPCSYSLARQQLPWTPRIFFPVPCSFSSQQQSLRSSIFPMAVSPPHLAAIHPCARPSTCGVNRSVQRATPSVSH